MPSEIRARRVADRINRELATLLQREVSDPRLSTLTVTGVDVDRELAYATIYVTGHDPEQIVMPALERARGYLRKQLSRLIPMRSFPQLRFRWDYSPDRGARIDELLDRLQDESMGSGEDAPPDTERGTADSDPDEPYGHPEDTSLDGPQDEPLGDSQDTSLGGPRDE